MNTQAIASFAKGAVTFLSNNKSRIAVASGVVGLITAGILAVKVTPKAYEVIQTRKQELKVEKLPIKETVKVTWKIYTPAIVLALISATSTFVGLNAEEKKTTALTAACALSESYVSELQNKTKEIAGEDVSKQIVKETAEALTKKQEVIDTETGEVKDISSAVLPSKGDYPCMDANTGLIFMSNATKIENAFLKVETGMAYSDQTVNDLYDILDIDPIGFGEDHGFQMGNSIEYDLSNSKIIKGVPTLLMKYSYDDLYYNKNY